MPEVLDYILEITEERTLVDDEGQDRVSSETYRVSTKKLEQWVTTHEFEYAYIRRLIKDCLAGIKLTDASRKYSFGDTPDWWEGLEPDADCTDPVKRMEVNIF